MVVKMVSLSSLAATVGWHHATVWQCLKRHRIPFERKNGKIMVRRSFRPAIVALLKIPNYALGFQAARASKT